MMRRTRHLALMALLPVLFVAVLALLSAGAARASQPWRYVQALQAFQDRVAHGDRKAYRAHVRLLAHLGRQFGLMADEVWKDRLNAEALFIFLLGGGSPAAAKDLLKRKVEVNLPDGALEGAIAYAEGRNGRAWELLRALDASGLTVSAQAQLALARAALRAAARPREALALLARVRLLKPGTLLEEVALRRALFLAGEEGDVQAFARLASAYLRRFHNSWYVSDFLRRFSWLLARLDYQRKPFLFQRLAPQIALLTKRRRALLHAALARAALLEGKRALALAAGREAVALYPRAARFAARVNMWMAAARVVSPAPEEALKALRGISPALLDARDRKLRLAAMTVARAIMDEPEVKEAAADRPDAGREAENLPVLARAGAMIADIEKLLRESGK